MIMSWWLSIILNLNLNSKWQYLLFESNFGVRFLSFCAKLNDKIKILAYFAISSWTSILVSSKLSNRISNTSFARNWFTILISVFFLLRMWLFSCYSPIRINGEYTYELFYTPFSEPIFLRDALAWFRLSDWFRWNLKPKLKLVLLIIVDEGKSLKTLVFSISSYFKKRYFLSNWYFWFDLSVTRV